MVKFTRAIIAGGKSQRMGQDKAFLSVGGIPIIERILQQTAHCGQQATILITNTPDQYAHLGLTMFPDVMLNSGSLGGIYSALVHSRTAYTFVTAVDMPFVSGTLWQYMLGIVQADMYDIVVPRVDGYAQGLHALYRDACVKPIAAQLRARQLKVIGFYDAMRVKYLDEDDIAPYTQGGRALMNVNTPEEFARAQALADT